MVNSPGLWRNCFKKKASTAHIVKGIFKIFEASICTIDKEFTTAEFDLWINALKNHCWLEQNLYFEQRRGLLFSPLLSD